MENSPTIPEQSKLEQTFTMKTHPSQGHPVLDRMFQAGLKGKSLKLDVNMYEVRMARGSLDEKTC